MKNKAFTLVELLVVIGILSILTTIGIMSYSGYSSSTRDTNRITQLNEIYSGLNTYISKQKRVSPDSKIDILSGGEIIAYQGYAGKKVLGSIKYSADGIDPKDGTYFSLYMTKNKKYFQLMAFLEESTKVGTILGKTNAVDYNKRIPYVKGSNLGILVDENNVPIQEVPLIKTSGEFNISDVGDTAYKSFIKSGNDLITGTGTIFSAPIKKFAEVGGQFCKSTNLTCDDGLLVGINGVCGGSHKGSFSSKPTTDLCLVDGSNTSVNELGIRFVWTCKSQNGGITADCWAYNELLVGTNCIFGQSGIGNCSFN